MIVLLLLIHSFQRNLTYVNSIFIVNPKNIVFSVYSFLLKIGNFSNYLALKNK